MTGPKRCTGQQTVCTVIDNITHRQHDCPPITGTALAVAGDGLLGELTLPSPALSGCMRQFVHAAAWKLPISRQGGFCVVASASACVDFFFDFVALCRCIGADGATAVAAVAPSTNWRRSRGGSAASFALHGWRGAAGDRPGSGTSARSRGDAASDHPGDRAQA